MDQGKFVSDFPCLRHPAQPDWLLEKGYDRDQAQK